MCASYSFVNCADEHPTLKHKMALNLVWNAFLLFNFPLDEKLITPFPRQQT